MPGSRRASSSLMLLCALSLLAHAGPARAQATNPDFSNVADILHGRRTLFPVDDVVVSFNVAGSPTLTTILQTAGGSISGQTQYTAASPSPSAQPLLVAAARMFNLPRAVVVTLFAGSTNLHDQTSGLSQSFPNAVAPTLAPTTAYAVTDLAGNGYAAIVFIGNVPQAPSPTVPGGAIGTIMAANVNDPTQGFFYGTPMSLPLQTLVGFEFGGIAAGDFDGDGANEIAVSYLGPCPAPCSGGYPIIVAIFKPNVTTDAQGNVTALTLVPAGSVTVQPGATIGSTLAAGKYLGSPSSQLALIYSGPPGTPTTVQPIAVSATSDPTQVSFTLATPLVIDQHMYLFMSAQSGPLDYFENTEQLVVLLQRLEVDEGTLAVVTFDSQLNASVASSVTVPGAMANPQLGIALGNFDQSDPGTGPLALQIAVVLPAQFIGCTSPSSALAVQIYQVAPASNFALSAGQLTPVASSCSPFGPYVGLATGDTQGRSLILGPPSKLTSKHTQPELILGAPPMHVDYVTPANSSGPIVLNLSAVPQGFNSSYKTTITDSTQSSRQATTSYTNAVNASTTVGFKFGTPLTGDVSAKVGISAGFMHRKSIEKRYGQYASTQFDASTITGFDDQVWFSNKTHYIFMYPVIGQTACPADTPNCTDPGPMFVMFSGPTVNLLESAGGATLEWYQPIHETGNVFSYPWSLEQLQAAEGGIDLLTSSDPDGFATDSSTHTAEATWAGQQTTTSTSGTASNISWKVSTSVTESAGIFGGAVGSQNFSYNGSVAISTLNTLTTKVGESTGIGIVKPGTFPSPPLYQYPVFPYVFGDNPVPGTLQNLNLGTQLQTSGILRAAYTADPTNPSAGSWWQGAYTLPDVAVNHPTRWSTQLITPTAPQPNCIPVAATSRNQACVSFNPPEPDIWTSEFHYMKGLLITPAGVSGEGPQLTQATAGAPILLQTRVYNYSLADMPAGSSVVVQFYGQPWDPSLLVPAGNAFLIDSVQLPPLPGFNSASSGGTTPNWTIARTEKLDTTSYGDQYLVFWVLVYMTNALGLVPEMPGHGLTAMPPTLDSIAAATAYLEPYSNNIGFYRSLFYIASQGSAVSSNPAQAAPDMRPVEVSASRVFLGDKVIVSGLVHAADAVDGLSVLFRAGTPTNMGNLFDVEPISHIRADGAHLVKTVYRPSTCGTHVLSLQVMNTAAAGQATIEVTVDVLGAIEDLRTLTSRRPHRDGFLQPLAAARAAFETGTPSSGVAALQQFKARVQAVLQPNVMTASLAALLFEKVDQVLSCVR